MQLISGGTRRAAILEGDGTRESEIAATKIAKTDRRVVPTAESGWELLQHRESANFACLAVRAVSVPRRRLN